MDFLRSSFNVFRLASLGDSALRIARVFFGRKSSGLNFFPRYNRRKFSFVFWCITMYTRAMALRTTRLINGNLVRRLLRLCYGCLSWLTFSTVSMERLRLLLQHASWEALFWVHRAVCSTPSYLLYAIPST